MTDSPAADGPPRTLLIAAVVVAVSVLITVLGIAALLFGAAGAGILVT